MTAKIPTWITIVCSLITLLSVFVTYSLFTDPSAFIETVDFSNGETRLIAQMWGVRQFAIAFIIGYSLFKRSSQLLFLAMMAYFLMTFLDIFLGLLHKDYELVIGTSVFSVLALVILIVLNKRG